MVGPDRTRFDLLELIPETQSRKRKGRISGSFHKQDKMVGPAGPTCVRNINALAGAETPPNIYVFRYLSQQSVSSAIFQRDDGQVHIGLGADAPDPFPRRRFAETVARHAC